MSRKPLDIEKRILEVRNILEKYNGIPSQKVDRKSYAMVAHLKNNYGTNPKVSALLEEFNIQFNRKTTNFDEKLKNVKEELEKIGKIPSINEQKTLYCYIRSFFTKYKGREEIIKLKYIYAYGSNYPLAESKETQPEYLVNAFFIGQVPEYTKWKQRAAFEYIIYVYKNYQTLPAPLTKPMVELNYTIEKWNKYQDNATEHFKNLIKSLINLGCKEDFIIELNNSLHFNKERLIEESNNLLIEHGACAIEYLYIKLKPIFGLSRNFLYYFFCNLLNNTHEYRGACGLGELYNRAWDTSASCLYIHYRLLDKCNEQAIKNRVLMQNRNWEEKPPVTLQEWEAFGEYRFFIPRKNSYWDMPENMYFKISLPKYSIENGKSYFRYYKYVIKYLDYKLFLLEKSIELNKLYNSFEMDYISPKSLARISGLSDNKNDVIAAYRTALSDKECYVDDSGGIYHINVEKELELLFAPINATYYELDPKTKIIATNAFEPCKHSIVTIVLGSNLKKVNCNISKYQALNSIICTEEFFNKYKFLYPEGVLKISN